MLGPKLILAKLFPKCQNKNQIIDHILLKTVAFFPYAMTKMGPTCVCKKVQTVFIYMWTINGSCLLIYELITKATL